MLFVLLSLARAQTAEPEATVPETAPPRPVVYKSVTELDLEGAGVGGEHYGPSVALVPERTAGHFHSLIVVRADFEDELSRSTDELR